MESKSLGDMLRSSCQQRGDKPAMLYREGHEFKSLSYRELFQQVRRYAGALRSLGLKQGDRIAIQSESCMEWALADWACQCLGIVLVPVYPTLPDTQSQYIVKDCGAHLILVSDDDQAAKMNGVADLRVIYLKDKKSVSLQEMAQREEGRIDFDQLNAAIDATKPDDIATIIYTSGTTGPPKGAMLTHRNITFVCGSAIANLPINSEDIFLSFLPMSHVYERVAGQALPISAGATIAYNKSLMTLGFDMASVKPTIMLCVPRFLEATRDRVVDQSLRGPFLRRMIMKLALSQCTKAASGGFAPLAGLMDGMVGKQIREKTGGRIRFFVSGGAALAPHVSLFYRAFKLTVLQGYGLTETAAATCVNHPDRNRPETVGEPIPGVELSIASDGEILVKGPSVMKGYYNLPDATREAIDQNGWFHTGDIGQMDGKNLKITDRKKDLLVLANGKKVAPQPIENSLRESPFINEAVLFGDRNEYVYALIIPNFDRLRAELNDVDPDSALAQKDSVKALIRAEVGNVNKRLADFEKVRKHAILTADFSIETGELTPSLKVRRRFVREKYAAVLAELGE